VIEPVERADDPRIEDYRHVGDHERLRERGLFVAEGRLVVRRLLESQRFPVRSILVTPAALQGFGAPLDLEAPLYVAPPGVVNAVTGFNFHRGCLALAGRPSDDVPGGRFVESALLLALEGIGNPDNVGGLFRVAAAFGVDGVILDPATGDPFYRKAVRTSMAAVLRVPFERAASWPDALHDYRREGFALIALTPRADAVPIAAFATEAREPMIVMAGAEGPGLSSEALDAADVRVRIPIARGVDSLNVTVAAAIALAYLTERAS
jgi:tRNA G18 (ribose-2'-O)-methylase SpoU